LDLKKTLLLPSQFAAEQQIERGGGRGSVSNIIIHPNEFGCCLKDLW